MSDLSPEREQEIRDWAADSDDLDGWSQEELIRGLGEADDMLRDALLLLDAARTERDAYHQSNCELTALGIDRETELAAVRREADRYRDALEKIVDIETREVLAHEIARVALAAGREKQT